MNKRQKKKLVKVALLNTFLNIATSKDKHILNTIGTNKKVIKELKTNQIILGLNSIFSTVAKVIGSVFEAISEAIVTFAKHLESKIKTILKTVAELKKKHGLTTEEALEVIMIMAGNEDGLDAS